MSHVVKIELDVKDLDALRTAAERLGLEFVRGQTSYKWYGRLVGGGRERDAAVPWGVCDHVIRVRSDDPMNSYGLAAYEIGVCQTASGRYELRFDSWGPGHAITARAGERLQKLRQEYGVAVAERKLRAKGYQVRRVNHNDGRVVLQGVRR